MNFSNLISYWFILYKLKGYFFALFCQNSISKLLHSSSQILKIFINKVSWAFHRAMLFIILSWLVVAFNFLASDSVFEVVVMRVNNLFYIRMIVKNLVYQLTPMLFFKEYWISLFSSQVINLKSTLSSFIRLLIFF